MKLVRHQIIAGAGLTLVFGGCSVGTPQQECSAQLKQSGITDITWEDPVKTSDGQHLTGSGTQDGGTVDVECTVDENGKVTKTTSGSPQS